MRYQDKRVAELIKLLNKFELMRIKAWVKFSNYKQQKRKTMQMEVFNKYDRLVCMLFNRILKLVPKETMLFDDKQILKGDFVLWNRYTNIKFI